MIHLVALLYKVLLFKTSNEITLDTFFYVIVIVKIAMIKFYLFFINFNFNHIMFLLNFLYLSNFVHLKIDAFVIFN